MTTENTAVPLRVLQALLEEATPAEKPYLERQVQKYGQSRSQDSGGEPSPDVLRASIDQGYQGLYWYRSELDKPDVDAYWTEFLTQQINRYEQQLERMVTNLSGQGIAYTAPAFDAAALAQSERLEAARDELRGLRQLQSMTLAWQERHPSDLRATQSIQDIEMKITALEQRLNALIINTEHTD